MAWDDPSPRARAAAPRAATVRPASQPGYGAEPVSFGRLMFRLLLAGSIGVLTALGAKACLAAWHGHGAHAALLDLVLAATFGFAAAALAWKYVTNRAAGGFVVFGYGRRRYADSAVSDFILAEVVGDVVSDVIDAVID
jgi:hypothetical protein